MKKIVITGAAGMIGSAFVRHLNELKRTNLILVDYLEMGDKWKNLVGKNYEDLLSPKMLFDWLKERGDEVEAIVHLGACSDTTEANGDYLLENNYRYTIQLATWALERNKRFVYASSAATYGDGSKGFDDNHDALEELHPLNMYGYSKHMVDLWMKRQGVLDKVVGLKYFNVFGPNEYHKGKMASMVLKMHQIAKDDGVIHLFKSTDPQFKDGDQCRDFIYVKDAVRMTCAFLRPEYRNIGGIFNIGKGEATTWNQLALALFDALKKEKNISYVDMPKELARQYQNYTCASMDKFHTLLSSEIGKTEAIPAAVNDYVRHYLLRSARW